MRDPGSQPSAADERPVVLVVDDERSVRELFVLALEQAGYRALGAATGREAIERLAAHPVDVVLLDRVLPEMSGDELLRRLRADPRTARMSVVMITGDAALDSKIDGLGAGANDYLVKPVALRELLARVGAQLEAGSRWQGHLERKLAMRSRLSGLLAQLPTDLTLSRLEAELWQVLLREFDLVSLEIQPVDPLASTNGAAEGAVDVHERTEGSARTRVRIPLRSHAGLVATLEVVVGAGQDDAVSTLLDLAPQITSLVTFALRPDATNSRTPRWVRDQLLDDRLRGVFQPIVSLDELTTVGVEGLSRFSDGTAPELAFRSATNLGLGEQLEAAALERLVRDARSLPQDQWLSVNLSAATVLSMDVPGLLAAADRPIVVEITEHEEISDYAALRQRSARLEGVTFAVDDAGAGYASLRHVLELQPGLVKLDRSWVSGIDTDPARQALIRGMVGLSDAIGASVVGEGIEREAEAQALASLGVPFGQGYFFGHPEPA